MPDDRRPAGRPRRERASEHLFVVLVAVACGLAGGGAAIVLRALLNLFQELFFAGALPEAAALLAPELPRPIPVGAGVAWGHRLLAPAIGGLVVGPLVYVAARETHGHGVPEVMYAVARRGGVIRPRVVAVKSLASAITIGSGGSAGREGPIVQIGSAVGSVIGQLLRLPTRQLRTLVACGAAAGIAATFN